MRTNKLAIAAALAFALGMTGSTNADEIVWQEITSLPLAQNVPPGLSVDILGIAPGMSYETVREMLLALAPDGATDAPDLDATARYAGVPSEPDYREGEALFYLPAQGSRIEARYPAEIVLERKYGEKQKIKDTLVVQFSAPSSGSQVMNVVRNLNYYRQEDQPRLSEVIAALSAKFGGEPTVFDTASGQTVKYFWRYDDQALVPISNLVECHHGASSHTDERAVAEINRDGHCDFLIELNVARGISEDHAKTLSLRMTDNDRGKANLTTDYGFFRSYIEHVQSKSGAAPKF